MSANAQFGLTPATATPINTGVLGRIKAAANMLWNGSNQPAQTPYTLTAWGPVNYQLTTLHQLDWFGPGQPLSPMAPPDNAGRRYDYPSYSNVNYHKKQLEGVDFETLKTLSYSYDLLRILIETRKDQICRLKWAIRPRDKVAKPNKRCDEIEDFLQSPDREYDWQTWLRALLEDMLVLDAASIFPRMTKGGKLYSLEALDGSTISRVIDNNGRTPIAPDPAYQQIIKGVPMCDYTRDQLIYRPRNIVNSRLYGYSPVEQIVLTVQTGISRKLYQLQYYTEGSMPDIVFGIPGNSSQIAAFDDWFNARLSGNLGARRRATFVPETTKAIDLKDKALTDPMDEWLARVCCYAFGISPQPFIKQMNRATAETAAQMAKEEGVGPHMAWVENLMSGLLAHPLIFNEPDLEFVFEDEDEVDPAIKMAVWEAKVKVGAASIDEWRNDDGLDPLPNGEGKQPLVYTASGAVLLKDIINPEPAPTEAVTDQGQLTGQPENVPVESEKLTKKKSRQPTAEQIANLKKPIAKALKDCARSVASQYLQIVGKAETDAQQQADWFVRDIDLAILETLYAPLVDALSNAAEDSFSEVLVQVGANAEPVFGITNTRAQQIAEQRAAELIGADANGGEMADATREMIRSTIADAFENGWSSQELADALETVYGFSEDRADLIAETELRMAMGAGEIEGARSSGVVIGKKWLTSGNANCCDICQANEDQGYIPLDEEFVSGDDSIPAHPRCACTLLYQTKDEV